MNEIPAPPGWQAQVKIVTEHSNGGGSEEIVHLPIVAWAADGEPMVVGYERPGYTINASKFPRPVRLDRWQARQTHQNATALYLLKIAYDPSHPGRGRGADFLMGNAEDGLCLQDDIGR